MGCYAHFDFDGFWIRVFRAVGVLDSHSAESESDCAGARILGTVDHSRRGSFGIALTATVGFDYSFITLRNRTWILYPKRRLKSNGID